MSKASDKERYDKVVNKGKNKKDVPKKKKKAQPKKKNGCLKCLVTSLVLVVVLCGGVVGGGMWAWGKYVQPTMGITLFDAFGALGGLYGAKEADNITNPYNKEAEMTAFYDEFKKKMFIDPSVKIDLETLLGAFTGGTNQAPVSTPKGSGTYGYDYVATAGETPTNPPTDPTTPPTDPTKPNGSITGNPALDNLLKDLKFNFSSLATQDLTKANILEMTDKQFAALIDTALGMVVKMTNKPAAPVAVGDVTTPPAPTTPDATTPPTDPTTPPTDPTTPPPAAPVNPLEKYGIKLEDIVSVGQVIIKHTNVTDLTDVQMRVTLKLNVAGLITPVVAVESKNEFLGSLAAKILPKTLYVSLTIFPYAPDREAEMSLNTIEQQKINNILNGIDQFMTKGDPNKKGVKSIFKMINTQVQDIVTKMNTYIPLSFVDSKCEIKPIEGMMKVLKVTITEQQFLSMIRDVTLPTATSLGLDKYTDALRDGEVDKFIATFTKNYGINNSDNSINSGNIVEAITSLVSTDEGLKKLNIKDMNFEGEYDAVKKESLQVKASYLALSGLMNGILAKQLAPAPTPTPTPSPTDPNPNPNPPAGGLPTTFKVTVLNIEYETVGDDMKVTACGDISGLFDSMGALKDFVLQLLPTKIYITIDFSKTDATKLTTLDLNKLGVEATKAHFATICSLAESFKVDVSKFNYDSLCGTLDKTLRESFAKMETSLGDTIKFEKDNVVIPNIYQLISGLPMLKKPNEPDLTDKELYDVLKTVYKLPTKDVNVDANTNANAFAKDLSTKFYLSQGTPTTKPVLDGANAQALMDSMLGLKDTFQDNLVMHAQTNAFNEKQVGLCDDMTLLSNLKPSIKEEELGFLLQSQLAKMSEIKFLKSIVIYNSRIAVDGVNDNWTFELEGAFNFETPESAKFATLLPKTICLKMVVNIQQLNANLLLPPSATPAPSCVTLSVNGCDEATMKTFMRLMSGFGGGDMNMDKLQADMSRQMEKFIKQMTDVGMAVRFEQTKLVIDTTVFNFANDILFKGDAAKPDPQMLREVIQQINDPHKLRTQNKAGATDALVNELNSKYYLNISTATPDLVGELAKLGKDFATLVDGKKMSTDTRKVNTTETLPTYGEPTPVLSPIVSGSQMAAMLASKINIGGSSTPFTGGLSSVYVLDASHMEMMFKILSLNLGSGGTAGKYDKLMPKALDISATVDMSKLTGVDLCISIAINQMSPEHMAVCEKLLGKVAPTIKLADMTKQVSDMARTSLSSLTASMSFELKPTILQKDFGGCIILGDIYSTAINALYKGDPTAPQPIELQDCVKALFTTPTAVGQRDFVVGDKMATDAFNLNLGAQSIEGQLTDRNVGYMMTEMDASGTGIASKLGIATSAMTYKQLSMFNNSNATKFAAKYPTANFSTSSYLLATINLQTSALMGNTSISMLPDNLDVTLIVDLESGLGAGKATATMLYNNLNDAQVKIMSKLIEKNMPSGSTGTNVFSPTIGSDMANVIFDMVIINATFGTKTVRWTLKDLLAKATKENGRVVTTLPAGNYDGLVKVSVPLSSIV
ncbi:MAG: hypothetical protein RR416_02395 [Clostridia bacterium]